MHTLTKTARSRIYLIAALVAAGSGFNLSFAQQNARTKNIKNRPATSKTILFFGNSLSAGYGVGETQAFPNLIQAKIDSLALPFKVVNAGLSGETSAGGLRRIDWLLRQKVDVLVLELGGNDALRGIDLQLTKKNLQAIMDKTRAKYPKVKILLAGMQVPPNWGESYATTFRQMYIKLAVHNRVARIPFLLEGVGGVPELNLPDQIHPNAAGHRIVAENVWQVLREVLDEFKGLSR